MHSPYGEFDAHRSHEALMTDRTPHLPHAAVSAIEGPRSRSRILCIQGLCIAIVDKAERLPKVIADLSEVMPQWHAVSASALVQSKTPLDVLEKTQLEWANKGISIKRATTDAESVARGMLDSFLLRRQSSSIAYRLGIGRL